MSVSPGTRLGVYEITAQIGAGGMGEVYRATDTNLKRQVAIKVLPASVAADTDRLARFQREAEVLAALNHPHIAAIYGLEKTPEFTALVMELVEGDDLSQRIAKGAMPLDEALPIAKQIAEALEAAHEQGIIHRDLKPANIKVRADGTVKVLDFGLAKATPEAERPGFSPADVDALANSPTITTPAMTQAGMILGTAAYMAPEQAKGEPADRRSDIWALGVVLFEMLTARRAFAANDVATTLATVLMKEPDWSLLPPAVPADVRRLLKRCLQKDRRQRLADAADVRMAIDDVASESPVPESPAARHGRLQAVPWTIAVLAATAAVFLALGRAEVSPGGTTAEIATSLTIEPPAGTRFVNGPDRRFAMSPDGTALIFSAIGDDGHSQLWLRRLDELDARPIPGTARATSPFFSPDSRSIAFMVDGQVRRLALAGGLSSAVVETQRPDLRGATWTASDTMLLGGWDNSRRAVGEVPASGGEPRDITTPQPSDGDQTHRFPQLLPDGRHLLYLVRAAPGRHGIYVSEIGRPERRLVLRALTSFAFIEPRFLLYGDAGHLMAAPFNAETHEIAGEPRILVPSVRHFAGSASTEFSASARAVALRRGSSDARIDMMSVRGTLLGTVVPAGAVEGNFDISPDGRTVAYGLVDPDTGRRGIWLADIERKTQRRLTPPAVNAWWAVWSPDGTRLAVNIDDGVLGLLRLDGTSTPDVVDQIGTARPMSWSAGDRLIVSQALPGRQFDVVAYDVAAGQVRPLVSSAANEAQGTVSPSGRLLAYTSDGSGREEVYVKMAAGAAEPVQVSTRGGTKPVWSRDGQDIYYVAPAGAVMAARISSNGTAVGEPQMLFEADPQAYIKVMPGGDLLMMHVPDNLRYPNISVIVNWQRLLSGVPPVGAR